ncbi:sulfite exporter TauE/SafE family protein [Jiella sonneratiae]|uniref:Probable membrane transporter protein n=1 Tax=Jiella sonneratiae TaxID=2816856 RepID=A0ABS3IYR9_9HYPH|nr:sulfite exporter TauE/SafE family protein [Jiella sonneratiae]MBO0902544.1 sulfite exporter TauE/SafE family protein [Jiella sonneratiae]
MGLELLLAFLAVIVAAVVRGATGFGFSLVAAPLLSLLWPAEFATGIVLCLDLFATALLVRGGILAGLDRREAALVGSAGLVGAVAGVFALKALPAGPALIGLNVAVLVSALAALLRLRWRWLDSAGAAVAAGFLTGAMIGAFAVGGTLVVAWLMASRRTPDQARALLAVVFALTDTGSIALRAFLGLLPASSLTVMALLAPAVVAGIVLGKHVYGRISAEAWKRAVACLLIVLALASLSRALTLPSQAASPAQAASPDPSALRSTIDLEVS